MSDSPVIPERWGRDHFSTFAYLGSVVHDNARGGSPDPRRMRCRPGNPLMHPQNARVSGDKEYPTRLRGGVLLRDHDDYDCADDIVAAGLLEDIGTGAQRRYRMTEAGLRAWHYLCAARPNGSMSTVTWEEVVEATNIEPRPGASRA